jgi:phosphatidylserine decarboxylase
MGAGTCSPVPNQSLAVARNNHRGRSLLEGMKVAGILGLAFAVSGVLAFAALPAKAWEIGIAGGVAWIVSSAFVFFFFRDAKVQPPVERGVILSPAHGTIDYIDTTIETCFLNGPARRISIYLSLLNVHVQHAPGSGSIELLQHFPGRWSRAIRRDASLRNEHLLVGLALDQGPAIALRLISGIWVRRIVPWIARGQRVVGGERIGLIRFGSRVDVFLPLGAQVSVEPGDRVRGGETILARFPDPLPEERC